MEKKKEDKVFIESFSDYKVVLSDGTIITSDESKGAFDYDTVKKIIEYDPGIPDNKIPKCTLDEEKTINK